MNRSDALKAAWDLAHSCDWIEGEKEKAKLIPLWAVKMVYEKLEKNTNLFADAYTQCGWKFRELLKIVGKENNEN